MRFWLRLQQFAALIAVSVVLLTAVSAYAQDADAGVAAGTTGRETEFVAMTGPARESVPGGALLVSAYAAIWLILCAYVGRLALLQSSTSKELARLEAALRTRDAKPAEGKPTEAKTAEGKSAESKKAEKGK